MGEGYLKDTATISVNLTDEIETRLDKITLSELIKISFLLDWVSYSSSFF